MNVSRTSKLIIKEHKIVMIVGNMYPTSQKILTGLHLLARRFGQGNHPSYVIAYMVPNRIKTEFVWEKIPSHFSSKDKMLDIQRACGRKPSFKRIWFNKKKNKMICYIEFNTCENAKLLDIYFVEPEEYFDGLRSYQTR